MNARRDFLKFFGVGAVIAPVVEGSILMPAAATLVEVPRIELVQASILDMPRLWKHRLDDNPHERLWLARWRKEEANYRVLEHLVGRPPTEDERAIVAALMQWFGTNCGLGFLHDTFRAEGLYLRDSKSGNQATLLGLYNAPWPEFVQLRMTGGPPEIV